jgi:hypothetical protein
MNYDRRIVDIDTFLSSPEYMGVIGGGIYPRWKAEMRDFLSSESVQREWVFSGGISIGKSMTARLVALYKLYQVSCLHNPQTEFGLDDNANIVMAFIGSNKNTVEVCTLKPFVELMRMCDVFEEVNSQNKLITHDGKRIPFYHNISDKVVNLGKNISVVIASNDENLIGENVFSILYDEANGDNVMFELYNKVITQIKLRFDNAPFVYAAIIDGAPTKDDLIESYLSRLNQYEKRFVKVTRFTKWEANPSLIDNSDGYFYVLNGSLSNPSSILTDEQAKHWLDNPNDIPLNTEIVKVPMAYQSDFKRNIEYSLRDIAGVPTA